MTIFLSTPVANPERVRVPVPPVKGAQGFAAVDLRSQLTTDSRRPDAAAPLGVSGRWF